MLRIGKNDAVDQFSISDVPLQVVTSCCDMGITVYHSTSFNEHIKYIVGKGHQRANMIHRCSVYRNVGLHLLVRAFTVYVRFLLEYNCAIWSSRFKQDITAIEQVQKRFTKRLPCLRPLPSTERLRLFNLQPFELRRLHFDPIWCYKIVFGITCINRDDLFEFCVTNTKDHPYILYKPFSG